MKYVKVKKIAIADNPQCETAIWEDYKPGEDNGNVSPPVEYTIEGYLLEDLKVGNALAVDRRMRNGVAMSGLFRTSVITQIINNLVVTQNSKYLVESK